MLNGSPKGFFKSSRGLRQGDPLSPLQFLIIGEALSKMLSTGQEKGILKGIIMPGIPNPITHIQFANDTPIFSEVAEVYISNLRTAIFCFEAVSGLRINLFKSKLFGINISDERIRHFADCLGCSSGSLPSTFVGLPLSIGPPPKMMWDSIINRFQKSLADGNAGVRPPSSKPSILSEEISSGLEKRIRAIFIYLSGRTFAKLSMKVGLTSKICVG
ncbi:uncharacterized protein LOC131230434 [Magnolia sinica]|uniref:uncharacterized protein LOC131230434 n=1 Tax=Magnolia sinica TaxID=86752 RepID=UPI00265862D4|nr:uncharacterized protein LOC131230434 [Magnolia sinica]